MARRVDYFNSGHRLRGRATSVALRVRERQWALFEREFGSLLRPETRVLDLGTTPDTKLADSNFFAERLAGRVKLTLCSPEDCRAIAKKLKAEYLPLEELSRAFKNPGFDLVLSIAVLEHVGSFDRQAEVIAQVRKAPYFFVTTPNRYFPVEFHTFLPLIHWLPKGLHRSLLGALGHTFWSKEEHLNLLGPEIRERFGVGREGVQYATSRVLGWPSNHLVYRSPKSAPRRIDMEPARSPFNDDHEGPVAATGLDFEYATCSNDFTFKQAEPSGLLYLDPRPTEGALGVIYPPDYEPYRFEELPGLVRRARDWMQSRKAAKIVAEAKRLGAATGDKTRVIDVGCGNGTLLRLLRAQAPKHWELHGSDLNAEILKPLAKEGITTHVGLPLKRAGSFDVVVLNQVIEHFADVRGLVTSCFELLKPGGVIVIETPNTEGWDAQLFEPRHWGGYHFPRHFYLFSPTNLSRLLRDQGFSVARVSALPSPAFWVQSFHHALVDSGFKRVAKFFVIRNPLLLLQFTLIDLFQILVTRSSSNMRVVAIKPRPGGMA